MIKQLLREYFSLRGCDGPEMWLLREYFSLGGCAGPESTVIFTMTLIKHLQNISLWEGVLVLKCSY